MLALVEYDDTSDILGVYDTEEAAMIAVKEVYPLAKFDPEDGFIITGYFGRCKIPRVTDLAVGCYQLYLRLLPITHNTAGKLQKLGEGLESLAEYKYKMYSLRHTEADKRNLIEHVNTNSVWYFKTKSETLQSLKQMTKQVVKSKKLNGFTIYSVGETDASCGVYIVLPMDTDEDDLNLLELYKFAKG